MTKKQEITVYEFWSTEYGYTYSLDQSGKRTFDWLIGTSIGFPKITIARYLGVPTSWVKIVRSKTKKV